MKKKYKKMIPIGILVIIGIWIYSYFHVSGREIEYVKNISDDACTVTIIRYQHMEYEQRKEYVLDAAQIEQLKKLILESSFTRYSFNSGVTFRDRDMYDIRVVFNNRQDFIGIHCIGNEYISLTDQFDGCHLKNKNPNWKASLEKIITS